MALVNVMENIVRARLKELLKSEPECCQCSKCYNDMMAIALNKLEPMYVNSKAGELFSKLNTVTFQKTVDIDIAVTSAINTVKSYPHHEPVPEDDEDEAAAVNAAVADITAADASSK